MDPQSRRSFADESIQEEQPKVDLSRIPHMLNLNEDPLLNGKIVYDFTESPCITVGRQSESDDKNERQGERKVVLNGVGIIEDHARLVFKDRRLSIMCAAEKAA